MSEGFISHYMANKPIINDKEFINASYCSVMYELNSDFKAYVDKYCTKHGYPLHEALRHDMIHSVAQYYDGKASQTIDQESKIHIDISEDKSC